MIETVKKLWLCDMYDLHNGLCFLSVKMYLFLNLLMLYSVNLKFVFLHNLDVQSVL